MYLASLNVKKENCCLQNYLKTQYLHIRNYLYPFQRFVSKTLVKTSSPLCCLEKIPQIIEKNILHLYRKMKC